MTTRPERFAQILNQVQQPGDFYATGTVDMHAIRLDVTGIGSVALPLLPIQAEQLIAMAEQAPYGQGTETLTDTNVRRTWQIGAEYVSISGKNWSLDLAEMVSQAVIGLGVEQPVEAELYKLLVYENENFFVEHRDTEKSPGMFATMVVVLPSNFQGGELLVRHQGQEVELDLHRDDPSEAAFAAFYADCRHEVRPVTSGHRLTLIYNLVRPLEGGKRLVSPDHSDAQQQLTAFLRNWATATDGPNKLVYPLEHAYTEACIGFDTFKGADTPKAEVLEAAATAANCEALAALLRIEESGSAECDGGYYHSGRGYEPDEAEFEILEVCDSSRSLSHWHNPDGSSPELGDLPFLEEEIAPPHALEDIEPSELEFSEATGNEGASFDRLYALGVLVVWPRNRRMAVIAQGNISEAIAFLGKMAEQWQQQGALPDSSIRDEADRLAVAIQQRWPTQSWRYVRVNDSSNAAVFIKHLMAFDDVLRLDAFLADTVTAGAYAAQDNPVLLTALQRLAPPRSVQLLCDIVTSHADRELAGCANLLRRAVDALGVNGLQPAAAALMEALASSTATVLSLCLSKSTEALIDQVAELLPALEAFNPDLAGQALQTFLDHPEQYDIDAVLCPAALCLHGQAGTRDVSSAHALCQQVMAHLRRRITEPLAPPSDWSRENKLSCKCLACADLAGFLGKPELPVWRYKAAKPSRNHVEEVIRHHNCDLNCSTDEQGRPYTLVCAKNQASYERLARQRRQDLKKLTMLE